MWTLEERQAVQNQICHTSFLPFFSNEILLTRKSLSWFEITDDNENKQYADNQCP